MQKAGQRVFEGRSTFIDALRGFAAFSVACYHIYRYGPLPEIAVQAIPVPLAIWFDHGWIGVQVFFVISGFVIAYSVRDARITPRYLANYALRRSIRLDPPYWTTIVCVLLVHWVFTLHLGFLSPMDVPATMDPPLSWKVLLAHMLYLQSILGYENLSAGFWTLCIEVQFYLLYVVGQGVAQRVARLSKRSHLPSDALPRVCLFAPLAILSLFVWHRETTNDMWLTHYFAMFYLGAAAWWSLAGILPPWTFWGYVALMAVRIAGSGTIAGRLPADLTFALATGVSIYVMGRLGRLGTALNYRWLQHLGRISYSLYLMHFPVAHVVTTLGYEHMLHRQSLNPPAAAGWLLAALLASLAIAQLMYRYIEAPSVRLAARLKPAAGSK